MSLVQTPYFITSKPALKSLLQYAPVWDLCSVSSRNIPTPSSRDGSARDLALRAAIRLRTRTRCSLWRTLLRDSSRIMDPSLDNIKRERALSRRSLSSREGK